MSSIPELLERVTDRQSFLAFDRALIADREDEVASEQAQPSSPYGPGANGWENGTIEQYMEAALAWAKDSGQLPEEPSWRAFATFLYAGKIYE
ncbi:MAG TPA: hypothetical protein VFL91_17870 [Thermomicrobiales bacterium]|nr:hypothetical protein [Thermomicrobiales bacterium]